MGRRRDADAQLRDVLDSSMADVHAPADTEERARAGGRRIRARPRTDATSVAAGDGAPTTTEAQATPARNWTEMPANEMAEHRQALLPEGMDVSHVQAPEHSPGSLVVRITTPEGPSTVELTLFKGHGKDTKVTWSDENGPACPDGGAQQARDP